MCLILFAWQAHPRYPLVLAANRDEFHQRPTAAADFWEQEPELLAGRDLQAGGTWLGVSRNGRFAAVTNYREPAAPEAPLERSRGELVTGYLRGALAPLPHAQALRGSGSAYRGFNLLLGTAENLVYVSNRDGDAVEVAPGCHGLSNHLLNTGWPKVRAGRARLGHLLQEDRIEVSALLELLADRALTPGAMPMDAGDGEIRRHLMSHNFILSPNYGTRSSTVLLVDSTGSVEFVERRFAADGLETGSSHFTFQMNQRQAVQQ